MNLDHLIRGGQGFAELKQNSVHVWQVRAAVTATELHVLEEHLAPDERMRAGGFRCESDRRRFIVCRGCLRLFCAAYLGKNPSDIRFCRGRWGKPELPETVSRVRFNVSHSGEVALLAFALDRHVGVDVETRAMDLDFASLAGAYFSKAERAAIVALPPESRGDLFFDFWTCKEASIKADGRGLSVPLDQFSVAPSQDSRWREVVVPSTDRLPPRMRVRVLDFDATYAAAVAAVGTDWDAIQLNLA
jgi:4'-phosphopantetheinyl transferase